MADAEDTATIVAQAIQQALEAQRVTFKAFIQTLMNNQAAAAAPPAAAPTATTGIYKRTPALIKTGPLDYSKKEDAAIFNSAQAPLENKFSIANPNVTVLLHGLRSKATTFGWADILDIDIGAGQTIKPLDGHGRVTLEQCQAHAATFIHQDRRDLQNNCAA